MHTNGGITVRWRMDAVTDLPTAIEIQNNAARQVAIFTLDGRVMRVAPSESNTTTIPLGERGLWSWEDQPHYGRMNDMRRVLVGPPWSLARDH